MNLANMVITDAAGGVGGNLCKYSDVNDTLRGVCIETGFDHAVFQAPSCGTRDDGSPLFRIQIM